MRIYLIPGLGVDHRIFMNLDLPGYELKYIRWIVPHRNEALRDYALRLTEQIDTSQPFILAGLSLGGMCATEIANVLKPEKVILISSCKTSDELPLYLKMFRFFPVHRLLGDKFYIRMAVKIYRVFGFRRNQVKLFADMLNEMPPGYFMRACNLIINWNNKTHRETIHIHGDRDMILPFRNVSNPIRVKRGSHVMLLNQPEEVSRIIMDALSFRH